MTHSNGEQTRTGIRVIRSRGDYDEMRSEMERLLDLDPSRGTPDRDRLDVLLVLLADYESREVPAPSVDPIDAIRFRLDQLGLKARDLEPYLGGRSRVSEVLRRKRPLSIAMIRALHEHLGIPAEALINPAAPPAEDPETVEIPWERYPVREMVARGWLKAQRARTWSREAARDLLLPFFAISQQNPTPLYRRSQHVRGGKEMDGYALKAWTARVLLLASERPPVRAFEPRLFAPERIRALVQLSQLQDGPRLAQEWLAAHGVLLVVEAHLPRTRLDGAALLSDKGVPIIGLTIRYDRLDHFWFTLLHECAHVVRHLADVSSANHVDFFDDLDVGDTEDVRESEADAFARESLVPAEKWQASAVAFAPSVDTALLLAEQVGVSPAVVAGRVRHEKRNFRLLSPLVGAGQVRRHFPEVHFA